MKNINYPKNNITVHFIDPRKRLKTGGAIIRDQFKKAISEILKKYPLKDIAYVVYDAQPYQTIPPIGIGGYTASEYVVIINIDPKFKNFPKSLKNELIWAVAHESAHIVRMKSSRNLKNLYDAFIFEGLADTFTHEICGPKTKLWHHEYYSKLKIPYKLADKEKNRKDIDSFYPEWFTVGAPKKPIPWTAGYALGELIIAQYLRDHPGVQPSEILNMPSKEFRSSFDKILANNLKESHGKN